MEQETTKPKRDFRIRKLTPVECLRLMDVSENDINKMMAHPLTIPEGADFKEWLKNLSKEDALVWKKKHISKSQLYKMAGNSIVVSCLEGIFSQLFRPEYTPIEQTEQSKTTPDEVEEEKKSRYVQLNLFGEDGE